MSADPLSGHPELDEAIILRAWRGSIAHGMWDGDHPDSVDDKDQFVLVVPSIDYYWGLREFGSRGTREIKRDEWDIVAYTAEKAIRMLAQGNPNILALLWMADSGYIRVEPAGQILLDYRDLFVGRWCYQSFVGYAKGQFHKMRSNTGLGYLGAKRKALVERHGFDPKNAAHLIRLLRMACEFLSTGELVVDRSGIDAAELLDIKHGGWPLEKVEAEAQRLFARAEEAYDRSRLPDAINLDAVNKACVEVIAAAFLSRRGLPVPV